MLLIKARIPLELIGQVAGASAWAEAGDVESGSSTRRHVELLLLQVPVFEMSTSTFVLSGVVRMRRSKDRRLSALRDNDA